MKFFQILFPEFKKRLALPPAFSDHLDEEDTRHRHAILFSNLGRSWLVKIGPVAGDRGMWFLEGWSQFVADHGLSSLDFLLFEYRGNLRFGVSVFGRNACEREEREEREDREEEEGKESKDKYDDLSFEVRITEHTSSTQVYIPVKCRRAMKLREDRIQTVEVHGEDGRSWKMGARKVGSTGFFCKGWKPFQEEMGLKQGDLCVFKLCSQTLMKFAVLRSGGSAAAAH